MLNHHELPHVIRPATSRSSLCFQTFYVDRPIVSGRVWDYFLPPDGKVEAAVFFIHGGGWRSGTRAIFHPIIDVLLDHGIACGSADYRLMEVTIADQMTDVRVAYAQFLAQLRRDGHDVRPILFGSSAGAHLALMQAMAQPEACGESLPDDPALRALSHAPPAGVAVVSAPLTFEPWDEIVPAIWNDMRRIVGAPYEDDPRKYRIVSPINHINDRTPPILLMQAQYEDVFPRFLTDAFMARMRQHGRPVREITYANAEHGFFYDVTRRCQQSALHDLLGFIRQCRSAEPMPAVGGAST